MELARVRALKPDAALFGCHQPRRISSSTTALDYREPNGHLRLVDDATLSLNLPMDAMRGLRVATYDDTETVYRLGIPDKVGAHVDVDFTRAAGPLQGNFKSRDGRLQVDGSRLSLEPPLEIDIQAQYFMVGPLEAKYLYAGDSSRTGAARRR